MKAQQINQLLELHTKSVQILQDILKTKQDILTAQDNLVLLERNPTFTGRVKQALTDKGLDYIGSLRTLLAMQSEQYAVIAQQLAEPFMPKESYLVTTYEMIQA
jgi:hypothetical protein